MSVAVVDASVWVSRFVTQDSNHRASYEWLDRHLGNGGIVAPMIMLSEVAGPIARQTGDPSVAHAALGAMLRMPGLRLVPVDRQLGHSAAGLAADLRLRGADAIYVALALSLSLPLVTWDRQQHARATAAIRVSTP